jgi:hypothetical protein
MSEPNSIVFRAPGRVAELMHCLVVRTISLQTVYECRLDPAIGKRRVWQCVSFRPATRRFALEAAAVVLGVCTAPDRGTGDSVLKEWWGSAG